MTKRTKLWVMIGIAATLFLMGIALMFSDPSYRLQIEKFQTLITGIFAIVAATIAFLGYGRAANINARAGQAQIQANFDLNRERDAALRHEEMLSVAVAIYSEILLLRKEVARLASIVGNTIRLGEWGYDEIDAQFVEDNRLPTPIIYPALAGKLGLLPVRLLIHVTQFFNNVSASKENLPLLVKRQRGELTTIEFSPLAVLEPALNAVYEVKPALREIEMLTGMLPANDPDVGLAVEILEEEQQKFRPR